MLGTVLTHLRTMATWLKTRFNAMILTPLSHWKTTGASTINQQIQSVISSLRASIKQSKDQLLAQSLTLLECLIKVVTTSVILVLGLSGLLYQTIAHLYHKLASKIWRKEH